MARWRILLVNEAPVVVEVDDERNLALEFVEFHNETQHPWWKFWKKRQNPLWQVTEDVLVHRDAVASIHERPERSGKRSIGFGGLTDVRIE